MFADSEIKRTNWLARAVIAGFCASLTMVVVFFYGYAIALPLSHLPLADARGALGPAADLRGYFANLVNNRLIDVASHQLYAALAMHGVIGIFWALVYAAFAEPHLPGRGWVRGVIFSLGPWILSLILFLPVVGGGFLGLSLGAGLLPAFGNLLMHLAYGATLGAVYAPASERLITRVNDARREERERFALQKAEGGAVLGMLLGLVAGLGLGMVVMLGAQVTHVYTILGLPDSWALVAMSVAGACLGALVGSLTTLPTSLDAG